MHISCNIHRDPGYPKNQINHGSDNVEDAVALIFDSVEGEGSAIFYYFWRDIKNRCAILREYNPCAKSNKKIIRIHE